MLKRLLLRCENPDRDRQGTIRMEGMIFGQSLPSLSLKHHKGIQALVREPNRNSPLALVGSCLIDPVGSARGSS